MSALPSAAAFHFPWEINTDLIGDGASVRVYGRLSSYQSEESRAVLSSHQSSTSCHVSVNTQFVEPFQPILGAQYLVLGEVEKREGLSEAVVRARALTCVDGVDFTLLQQAITKQRRFFDQRVTPNSD